MAFKTKKLNIYVTPNNADVNYALTYKNIHSYTNVDGKLSIFSNVFTDSYTKKYDEVVFPAGTYQRYEARYEEE